AVANVIKDSTVAGLCRANDRDIGRGIEALKGARSWRIHTFIATSALHMEKKLRMTPEQVLEDARNAVRFARKHCPDVEFSPEDAGRSEPDFLCRVLEAVIAAGATTVNLPDTGGYPLPAMVRAPINGLGERAGNAALEEVVMAVRTRADVFPCDTRIDTTQIMNGSRLVSG